MNFPSRADYGACLEVLLSAIYHRVVRFGDTVIDGGANGGLHTIPLGKLVGLNGHVYAYEAQQTGMTGLQRWVDSCGLNRVCILRNVAIGDFVGEVSFFDNIKNDALSSGRRMNGNEDEWKETRVPMTRIDDDNIVGRCSFIKLDLEGGERDAIFGARRLIYRDRPIIAFENGLLWTAQCFGYNVFDFLDFFAQHNYEVLDFAGNRVSSTNLNSRIFSHEFIAISNRDENKQTIMDTIREFNINLPSVPPAENWAKVMEQVQQPFSTGLWRHNKSETTWQSPFR